MKYYDKLRNKAEYILDKYVVELVLAVMFMVSAIFIKVVFICH